LTTQDPETSPKFRREPPPERTYWSLLPGRNFRRALFLIAALVAILVIRKVAGISFSTLFDKVAPRPAPVPAQKAQPSFQHLEVKR
jgi:hypothetical protein